MGLEDNRWFCGWNLARYRRGTTLSTITKIIWGDSRWWRGRV